MNRRAFFAGLSALLGALGVRRRNYGYVDVQRWWALGFGGTHDVFLDGLRITHCRWFNDITGEAERLVCDAEGRAIYDPAIDDAKSEILRGRIEIRRTSL